MFKLKLSVTLSLARQFRPNFQIKIWTFTFLCLFLFRKTIKLACLFLFREIKLNIFSWHVQFSNWEFKTKITVHVSWNHAFPRLTLFVWIRLTEICNTSQDRWFVCVCVCVCVCVYLILWRGLPYLIEWNSGWPYIDEDYRISSNDLHWRRLPYLSEWPYTDVDYRISSNDLTLT